MYVLELLYHLEISNRLSEHYRYYILLEIKPDHHIMRYRMKDLLHKLKQHSRNAPFKPEDLKKTVRQLKNSTTGRSLIEKFKSTREKMNQNLTREKQNINNQHFNTQNPQQQQQQQQYHRNSESDRSQRASQYKPSSSSSTDKISSFFTRSWQKLYQKKNLAESLKNWKPNLETWQRGFGMTKDRFRDMKDGYKDNYSWLLKEYYKDYSQKAKGYTSKYTDSFTDKTRRMLSSVKYKLSWPRRRIRWLIGFSLLGVFVFGLGSTAPKAYMTYKLEKMKLEMEHDRKLSRQHEHSAPQQPQYKPQ